MESEPIIDDAIAEQPAADMEMEVMVPEDAPSDLKKSDISVGEDFDKLQDDAAEKGNDKYTGEDEYDPEKYPFREWKVDIGLSEPICFNPVVSGFGVFCLWGVAIWCMVDPDGASETLTGWRSQITLYFTWLFMGTRCVFLFFLLVVAYKFGHIKMAPTPDEPPEFSTGSYFMMIFAAGVAVGLFVLGVEEPLWHRNDHYLANQGYRSQDEIDMFAINLTVTDWGVTAWAPYLVVAVSMGLAGHRFGLPMTFRSCFYPILGEYTWGVMGDLIDGFTIITTVAGVCTSLGLGAISITAGFQVIGWVDEDASQDTLSMVQNLTIWAITVLATISVMSGLHQGVQLLSQIAFAIGILLFFLVFCMDNTKFLMNLQVQEIGYYLQWSIIQLNFWTDAFGQLKPGEGRAIDGQAAAPWHMDSWMVFYQAWWIAWASFVGLFIARISRGRTVGEVIMYSLIAPVTYCILWFSVWGGVALRQARQADELELLGTTFFQDSTHFVSAAGGGFCYDVPQETMYDNGTAIFENTLPGVTPVCQFNPNKPSLSAYNLMYSYSFPDSFDQGLGPALSILFIIAVSIYFATSSDSGSLIVDHLSANGRMKHHWVQRFFWAVTEGAVATALLSSGGSDALAAVQAGSVISGLPFVVLLCYLLQCIWSFCEQAAASTTGEFVLSTQPEFSMPVYGGVFNVLEYVVSLGGVHPKRVEKHMHLPTSAQTSGFFMSLVLPFLTLRKILSAAYPRHTRSNNMCVLAYTFCFFGWISIFCALATHPGLKAFGISFLFMNGVLLGIIRNGFRARYNLRSNVWGDFISSVFFYPQVLTQMHLHCLEKDLAGSDQSE